MAELKPLTGRLIKLDKDGKPTGEHVEFTAATINLQPTLYRYHDSVLRINHAFYELNMQMVTTAKQLKALVRVLWNSEAELKAQVRTRRYYARSHGHAPKRHYKHGRVGVKRRG